MADYVSDALLNGIVFERYESLPSEVKFKVRTIRRWGFELVRGDVNGEESYFLVRSGVHAEGDEYEEGGVRYRITEILNELPSRTRIRFRIDVVSGRADVVGFIDAEEESVVFSMPAVELLKMYCASNGFVQIWNNLRSVGRTVEISKRHGETGKSLPVDAWPGELREAYRRLRTAVKDAGFGRVAVSYFGKSEDGKHRYRVSLVLPTLAVLDADLATVVEKALKMIPDY